MFKNINFGILLKSKRFQGIVLAAIGAALHAAYPASAWVGTILTWLGGLLGVAGVVDAQPSNK